MTSKNCAEQLPSITLGEWFSDGLEVGTAPTMMTKIAKVSGNSHKEATANAKLVAAAPELLSAALQMREAISEAVDHLVRTPGMGIAHLILADKLNRLYSETYPALKKAGAYV